MIKYFLYLIAGLSLFIVGFGSDDMVRAQTGYSRTFDGGIILSVITECTCSGGTLILFQSYVDQTPQQYIYQPGATILYAYYNIFTGGNYFLSTHFPAGVCLIVSGTTCTTTGLPQGTLTQIGSSL